jgi:hypothetical protein
MTRVFIAAPLAERGQRNARSGGGAGEAGMGRRQANVDDRHVRRVAADEQEQAIGGVAAADDVESARR